MMPERAIQRYSQINLYLSGWEERQKGDTMHADTFDGILWCGIRLRGKNGEGDHACEKREKRGRPRGGFGLIKCMPGLPHSSPHLSQIYRKADVGPLREQVSVPVG